MRERFVIKPAFSIALLLCLASAIYIGNAGFPGLLDDADASHATVSRAMLDRGDWVILYMNGIRYLMKAPFQYWAVAVDYRLFGATEFATRLPVALAMIGLTVLAYFFARRYFGERAGLYSGLVMCTGAGFFLFTRIFIPEAIYALQFTAIFYLFLRGWTGTLDTRIAYWGVASLTALAVLTRGLIGIIFPVAIIGLFIMLTRGWRRWRELRPLSSTLIFLAVAAPWHVLASMRAPTFLWSYFINEHFKRAVGTRFPPDYEAVPLWLWLGAHLLWFFPWSVFVRGMLSGFPKPRTWKNLSPADSARLMLVIWAGFILLFFSLTFGSRMEYYSFGGWPAIAILLGCGLACAEENSQRWVNWMQGSLAVVCAGFAVVLGALVWVSAKVKVNGDISSLLQRQTGDVYRVSMAHIMDLTPQSFAALRLPSLLAAGTFLFGFSVAWWLRRKQRMVGATVMTAVAMAVFLFAANIALGAFSPYLSTSVLAQKLNPQLRPDDKIAIYGEYDASSSVAFYTHRQLLIWNGRKNNLAAASTYPDAPQIFLTDATFPQLWQGNDRVFLFVPEDQREAASKRLAGLHVYLVAQSGGKALYSNQPVTF